MMWGASTCSYRWAVNPESWSHALSYNELLWKCFCCNLCVFYKEIKPTYLPTQMMWGASTGSHRWAVNPGSWSHRWCEVPQLAVTGELLTLGPGHTDDVRCLKKQSQVSCYPWVLVTQMMSGVSTGSHRWAVNPEPQPHGWCEVS